MDEIWQRIEKTADTAGRNGALVAACVGMGLLRAALSWVLASGRGMSLFGTPLDLQVATTVGQLCGIAAVMLFVHRKGPLARNGRCVALATALLLAGCLFLGMAQVAPWASGAVAAIGSLCAGAGYAALLLVWLEWCGCQGPRKTIGILLAAYLVSLGSWLTVEQGTVASVLISLVCYCALLAVLLATAYRHVQPERLPQPRPVRATYSWRIVAWVGLLAFAYGLGDGLTGMGHTTLASKLGMALPVFIVFGIALLSKASLDMASVYRITLPLMLVGLFASLLPQGWGFVAQMVMSAALASYQTLAYGIACLSAFIHRASAIPACGVVCAINLVCSQAGKYSEQLLHDAGLGELPALVAFFVIAVVASLILGDRDFSSLIIIRERSTLRKRRFDAMMREAGLSKREQTIFLLMTEGKGIQEIGDELTIAQGTVRAHVSHIYDKFGVHSRLEFNDMVEVGLSFQQGTPPR